MSIGHPAGPPSGLPPFQPPLPVAKRLNRNALTVAAVLMGITVLTALVVMRPGADSGSGVRAGQDLRPPVPSRPSFLDNPVAEPGTPPDMPAGAIDSIDLSDSLGMARVRGDESTSAYLGYGYREKVDSHSASYPLLSADGGPVSARNAAFQAALASTAVLPAKSPSRPDTDTLVWPPSAAPASAPIPGPKRSIQDSRRAFLAGAGDVGSRSVAARLEPASSPYVLHAGTVIPGALLTAINSDLPGDIAAQVTRDVFDSRTQRTLLIPRGAKLIGTYDNQVVAGQGRLLVAWTRLILPNGYSMTLPGLALKDPEGRTGARDRVDHHYDRVFGHALLLSAIGAGAQLSQARQQSIFAAPSAGQVAAGAVGQELSNVALEILRRGMDVPPTITIRQGQPFVVFLNGDLSFDGPYAESGERTASRGSRGGSD
jgi:type IV secretory pathway VirB10-like protein